MNPCHYGLLQLRPDTSREEGLNVGIVVVRAPSEVEVRVIERGDLVEVLTRLDVPRAEHARIERSINAFANRLRRLRDASAQGLKQFAASEAGQIELLLPHAVASDAPEAIARRLYPRLVRPRATQRSRLHFDAVLPDNFPTNVLASSGQYDPRRSIEHTLTPELKFAPLPTSQVIPP